jgi:hypothetical protein
VSGRFPPTYGIHETLSFQERDESNFKVYGESGERRASAPRRQNTPVVDPTSGFTSVGADAEDGNHKPIEPLVYKDHRPQSAIPYGRPITSPTPELRTLNAPWETKNKGASNNYTCIFAADRQYSQLLSLISTINLNCQMLVI